jgi:hypothetical protein
VGKRILHELAALIGLASADELGAVSDELEAKFGRAWAEDDKAALLVLDVWAGRELLRWRRLAKRSEDIPYPMHMHESVPAGDPRLVALGRDVVAMLSGNGMTLEAWGRLALHYMGLGAQQQLAAVDGARGIGQAVYDCRECGGPVPDYGDTCEDACVLRNARRKAAAEVATRNAQCAAENAGLPVVPK